MRHIPEEELHAYLDQGLSRSQCVEIESHLAACPSCQAARDAIAALRDRTTALLAKLAPPRGFPPAFDSLRRRAAAEASARRRRIRLAAWVASLVAAVGLGWMANYFLMARAVAPTEVARQTVALQAVAPLPITAPVISAAVAPPVKSSPVARAAVRRHRTRTAAESTVTLPPVVPSPSLQLSTVDVSRPEPELNGMWRTMSWDGAQAETGDKLPHIDGLPVVQVQLQLLPSDQGKQPLMVVAQQLSSGEVIRTIEGPTNDVSHLLAQNTISDPGPTFVGTDSNGSSGRGPGHTDRTMAMQRGDRMLVITGALPSDSLLAMIRRLNAEMRSK
jgi:putative zinc finger protein